MSSGVSGGSVWIRSRTDAATFRKERCCLVSEGMHGFAVSGRMTPAPSTNEYKREQLRVTLIPPLSHASQHTVRFVRSSTTNISPGTVGMETPGTSASQKRLPAGCGAGSPGNSPRKTKKDKKEITVKGISPRTVPRTSPRTGPRISCLRMIINRHRRPFRTATSSHRCYRRCRCCFRLRRARERIRD